MLSNNDFYAYKFHRNDELHHSLSKRFEKIIQKFKTLSKSNSYKKINKVSILNIDKDDSIMNILNKLTNENFATLSEKIIMKLNKTNVCLYMKQILSYCSKSDIDTQFFYKLILTISKSPLNTYQSEIDTIINLYIQNFLSSLDTITSISEKEQYLDFVNRNANNKNVYNTLQMVNFLVQDTELCKLQKYSVILVFQRIVDKLSKALLIENNVNEVFLLLECLWIYINFHESLAKNPWEYNKFLNEYKNNSDISKLGFKIKFKCLDICEFMHSRR